MDKETERQKPVSGLDRVLAGFAELLWRGVLIMLYGSKLGEKKSEKVARWGVVLLCLGVLIGGIAFAKSRSSRQPTGVIRRPYRAPAQYDFERRRGPAPVMPPGAPGRGPAPTLPPGGRPYPGAIPSRPAEPTGGE